MLKGEETRLRHLTAKKEMLALNPIESRRLNRLQEKKRREEKERVDLRPGVPVVRS